MYLYSLVDENIRSRRLFQIEDMRLQSWPVCCFQMRRVALKARSRKGPSS